MKVRVTRKELLRTCRAWMADPVLFSEKAGHVKLRPYQSPVIESIVDSVRAQKGLSFVVIFSRQSGKNETQLALYTYLLALFQRLGGDIIHVEPTYKPQTQIAMHRLKYRLSSNVLTAGKWHKQFGYVYGVGLARVVHLSGDESANVVGQTAGLLLSVNEAQTTWNVYSTGNNWGTAGCANTTTDREAAAIGTASVGAVLSAGDTIAITLDAASVQDWIDGGMTNYGLLLQVATENTDQVNYASSDHATAEYRPLLEIDYTVPAAGTFKAKFISF